MAFLCDCGYENDALTLADREWVCLWRRTSFGGELPNWRAFVRPVTA